MLDANVLQSLGQVSSPESGTIFRDFLRGSVRQLICVVMAAEVNELCGPKHYPGEGEHFRSGTSPGRVLVDGEREEVSKDLMRRLLKRGFACERRMFAVLDGSDALRSAVMKFFPDAVVQRCLVHKERNIRSKLSKKHWGELARLFQRLHAVQGKTAAQEVVQELEEFLDGKNAESLNSLHEAGDDLIALQTLNVPNTLHRNLLNTNAIENSFRSTRAKLGRVTRFRAETDQATRWLAFALLEAEKGFNRTSGYRDLPSLIAALERTKAD